MHGRAGRQRPAKRPMPLRPVVGQRTLNPRTEVRILEGQRPRRLAERPPSPCGDPSSGRRTQVVKGEVCKTSIQRFESARRLHISCTTAFRRARSIVRLVCYEFEGRRIDVTLLIPLARSCGSCVVGGGSPAGSRVPRGPGPSARRRAGRRQQQPSGSRDSGRLPAGRLAPIGTIRSLAPLPMTWSVPSGRTSPTRSEASSDRGPRITHPFEFPGRHPGRAVASRPDAPALIEGTNLSFSTIAALTGRPA
jgi:hypothetical protein